MSAVIDLTKLERAPDIKCELMPDGWYWATDRASFDPDPESRWYVIGRGKTKREAFYDLLQRLADVTQMPEPQYQRVEGITHGLEPAEVRALPYSDPDLE